MTSWASISFSRAAAVGHTLKVSEALHLAWIGVLRLAAKVSVHVHCMLARCAIHRNKRRNGEPSRSGESLLIIHSEVRLNSTNSSLSQLKLPVLGYRQPNCHLLAGRASHTRVISRNDLKAMVGRICTIVVYEIKKAKKIAFMESREEFSTTELLKWA